LHFILETARTIFSAGDECIRRDADQCRERLRRQPKRREL